MRQDWALPARLPGCAKKLTSPSTQQVTGVPRGRLVSVDEAGIVESPLLMLHVSAGAVPLMALVDSGASHNFIGRKFV